MTSTTHKKDMADWDIDSGRSNFSKRGITKCVFPLLCVTVFLAFWCIRTVEPAHLGVVSVFGAVADYTLISGLHFVNPMANVISFNLKTQLLYSENIVPTQEGLSVELDVSLLYHLKEESVRGLFVSLGVDYETTLIMPELQSAVRGLTSEVSAKALYTSGRTDIRDKLMAELQAKLEPRGISLEDVLLKGIKLPKQLIDAIELKAQAEQESARMEFVLSKEKQEANRKKVEAEGISSFQRIVSEGISPALLQWKGIEATEKLAMSDNSKIVVMGNTKDSLPVLLSTADGKDATKPTPKLMHPHNDTPVEPAKPVDSADSADSADP
jgi:regulator of protease activity HflC (stomatin/prohibitin superfamily)